MPTEPLLLAVSRQGRPLGSANSSDEHPSRSSPERLTMVERASSKDLEKRKYAVLLSEFEARVDEFRARVSSGEKGLGREPVRLKIRAK
jgi:hypothetical protein